MEALIKREAVKEKASTAFNHFVLRQGLSRFLLTAFST